MENLTTSTEIINLLKEIYAPTASAVGTSVQWAWDILIKQMYVHGFGYAIAAISSYGSAVLCGKIAYNTLSRTIDETRSPDEKKWLETYKEDLWRYTQRIHGQKARKTALIISFSIAAMFFWSMGSAALFNSVARVINPEYYAIRETINFVRTTPLQDEIKKAITQP